MVRTLLAAALLAIALPVHAVVDAQLDADRTSCVAPCIVQFDARGTSDANSLHDEFLDLQYEFEFGEKAANPAYDDVWGTHWGGDDFLGRLSKDRYVGAPLTAHVYESAGTFTARVTATNPAGLSDTATLVIQVQDPDVYFSGANTLCYRASSSGTFAGCPAGAQQLTQSSWTAIAEAVDGSSKRALLRRGDTFNGNRAVLGAPGATSGHLQVGAFGSGPKPVIATGGDASAIKISHNTTVMDLHLQGPTSNNLSSQLVSAGGCSRVGALLLRLTTRGGAGAVGWRCSPATRNQISMVDNDFGDAANNTTKEGDKIVDGDYNNAAIMGNLFGKNPTSFIMRIWSNNNLKVAFNKFNGSNDRSNIRFQAGGNAGGGDVPTEFFVFAYNTYSSLATSPAVAAQPPSNSFYNIIRNYIIEGNFGGSNHSLNEVNFFGQNAAIRNNVFKHAGGNSGMFMLDSKPMDNAGRQYDTKNIRLYRNTIYWPNDVSKAVFHIENVTAGDPIDVVGPVTLSDNLVYAPNDPTPKLNASTPPLYTVIPGNVVLGPGQGTPFVSSSPGASITSWERLPAYANVGADPLNGIDASTGGGDPGDGGSLAEPNLISID